MLRADRALESEVIRRAAGRCEYCHFPRLFHPRRDGWNEHFAWDGVALRGKTAVGRTTVVVLAINHSNSVAVREALRDEGIFQP